jgi:fibronectin-binding autotransporter adhesin
MNSLSLNTSSKLCTGLLLAALCSFCAIPAKAAEGTWNVNTAGNWTDAANWTPGIPNGVGDIANLTYDITAARTVSLNGDKTVGTLFIGDPASSYLAYTLSPGTAASNNRSRLIFDQTGSANAVLTVPTVGGVAANSISAFVVQLNDPLVITADFPNSTTTQLAISGIISDGAATLGLTKNGVGIVQLSGANNYKGGTTINAGRVNANNLTAFGTGLVNVASGGQVFINTASSYSDYAIAGLGYANTADTAAQGQAGAIRFANNRTIFGNVTVTAAARLGVDTTAVGTISGNLLGSGNLEINGPSTTTGTVNLLGSAAGYSGALSVARGNFNFAGGFGGSMTVAPVAGASTTLGAGTSIGGNFTLDSSLAPVTFRNTRGTLAITGNLNLTGNTPVSPATFPAPGTSTLTLMTYAAKAGAGTLTFDPTGYRGAPAVSVGANSAAVTGLDTRTLTWNNSSFDTLWNVNSSTNWTGGATAFFQGDAVVFGDTAYGPVTLEGTLRPHSVTFNSQMFYDYFLSGSGGIDGAGGGIIKSGASQLTLGTSNTFTGPVFVNGGRLILGSPAALGYTPGVTVASGASLDVNGQKLLAISRAVDVTLAGTGDGVLPALANNGATIAFAGAPSSGIRNVTLAADATIGGPAGIVFDIGGVLDGAGHTLTKVGANQVWLLGPVKNVNTIIAEGSLGCYNTDGFGTNLRVEAGAAAQAGTAGSYSSQVTLASGAKLELITGAETLWTGSITAEGDVELANANTANTTLTLLQNFSVPGNLTKSGNGTATLLGQVTVAGDANITTGNLVIGNGVNTASLLVNGTGGTGTGSITVNSNATLRGPGSVPVTVTVAAGATLAPGTVATIGTLTTGASTRPTTLQGTLRIKYDGAAAQATDALVAGGTLTLGAASVLDLQALGAPLTNAACVIAAYATLSGTFGTVTGLPAGYGLVYDYDDGLSANHIALVKTVTYGEWIAGYFPGVTDPLIVGLGADPDQDSIANVVENYLGTSPAAPSPGLDHLLLAGGSLFFQHTRADAPLSAFTASYQWSTDLTAWHASDEIAGGVGVNIGSVVLVDNPPPANDVIQGVATVTSGTAPILFIRLILTPR